MTCAKCGEEIFQCVAAYDLRRKEVTHTWPEMVRPDRRAIRTISASFPLGDTEVLMVGEPIVRGPDGKVYHERCYHGG